MRRSKFLDLLFLLPAAGGGGDGLTLGLGEEWRELDIDAVEHVAVVAGGTHTSEYGDLVSTLFGEVGCVGAILTTREEGSQSSWIIKSAEGLLDVWG